MATIGRALLGGFVISMMLAGMAMVLALVYALLPIIIWALVNFGAFGTDL